MNRRVNNQILRFAGLYTRHVLPTVLAGPSSLLREAFGPRETCSGCRIYPTYLGPRHLLCQWENSLLSRCDHRKPILANISEWRCAPEYQVMFFLFFFYFIYVLIGWLCWLRESGAFYEFFIRIRQKYLWNVSGWQSRRPATWTWPISLWMISYVQ